jgi:Dyp-type peroxidase family
MSTPLLELEDIQSGVLSPRPSPYVATYILFRIDDCKVGREMMRKLSTVVASVGHRTSPAGDAWVSVSLTFQGLKALGVPQESLDSFPPEFRVGMAARAHELGDTGESSPEKWEKPLGTKDVHVVLTALSPNEQKLESVLERAKKTYQQLQGIKAIWRQNCFASITGKEPFGFRDGINHPAVEGSGIPGTNPKEPPLKAGEFVLGYLDETGRFPAMPKPDILGRNGTYVVFRKLHQRVWAFRKYLKANSSSPEEEQLIAAKMMGRWSSGAPLALCPERDDPELGADPQRNNNFLFQDTDPKGFNTPLGSHIRRMNPRDTLGDTTKVNLHRMIRRGTNYGPPLPDGVLEDDGVDRGLIFVFIGAHLRRQFEFVQSEWVNNGVFIGAGDDKDPIGGTNDGAGKFIVPRKPVRKVLYNLPRFVVTRGGEYCFMPGIRALRWLADLDT